MNRPASNASFSIRFILVLTAAVAAGVAAASIKPSVVLIWAIDSVTLLFLTASIFGVKLTRGNAQAFWIGTALPLVVATVNAGMLIGATCAAAQDSWAGDYMTASAIAARYSQVICWCAAPINGLFAVLLHWLFAPQKRPGPPESDK